MFKLLILYYTNTILKNQYFNKFFVINL